MQQMWKLAGYIIWFIVIGILAIIDYREFRVCVPLMYFPMLISLGYSIFYKDGLVQKLITAIVVFGTFYLIYWMTNEALGLGDVYLLSAISLALPLYGTIEVIALSFILCAIFAIGYFCIKRGRCDLSVPFVPFIFVAYAGVMLCRVIILREAA